MKIDRARQQGVTVLRIEGEIDFSDTHDLLGEIRSLDAGGADRVLLDLRGCTGMASTAIGILVGWRCECSLQGREFWVFSPSPEVRELFDMVGISDQLVRPETSLDAAVEAVRLVRAEEDSKS